MNKYDKIIVFILLKICKIFSNYSENENVSTTIYVIEQELKEEEKEEK